MCKMQQNQPSRYRVNNNLTKQQNVVYIPDGLEVARFTIAPVMQKWQVFAITSTRLVQGFILLYCNNRINKFDIFLTLYIEYYIS